MISTFQQVRDAIGRVRFLKSMLRLIQQTHKQWRCTIEAGRKALAIIGRGCGILPCGISDGTKSGQTVLTLPNGTAADWCLPKRGITEEFPAVREMAVQAV